ncbi:ubiquinone/menaquinone biosynthesis C-methyltransferase UbiE [mine drainage metagenome]|uniref:Ubiquinone/menaquinone biosynthesis C-methyltransferase UbiE n=1 Tax=mine drainage metagenome TaxID=410659 RepID=A0A1J5SU00_9ZZZZ
MQAIEQALRQAVAHHQAGELQEAEKGYRAILQSDPHHPKANHNLGALYVQQQQPAAGLPFFAAALEADPAHGQYWLSYIDALYQAGQPETARQVLALARQSGLQGEDVDVLAAHLEADMPSDEEHRGRAVALQREASPTAKSAEEPEVKPAGKTGGKPAQGEIDALMALFTQGRSAEAVTLAQTMVQRFPLYGFGWKVLGAAFKQLGKNAEALAPMQRAAELLPNDAEAYSNLGGNLQDLGRSNEAVANLDHALKLNPKNADALLNMGVALQALGRHEEAEKSYRRALELKPDFAAAHGNLGVVLQSMGRLTEALAHFQSRARLMPGNAVDQHLIASLTGKNTERAPAKYVEDVFDSYADSFDTHLQQALQYGVPAKLAQMVQRHLLPATKCDVLDLGCGTGLVGVEFAPFAGSLVGVDLSEKMLERAQARNLYQRLVRSDLLPMMQAEPTSSFDVIATADVFIYLGKLDDVIAEVKRLLRQGGLFAFSVEDCEVQLDGDIQGDSPDYQLKNTGRYGQSVKYLERLASDNGFLVTEMTATDIRTEHGKPIKGHIGLWMKPKTEVISPTPDQLLQQAVAFHQAGKLEEAGRLYREILKIVPDHPEANHNLGVLAVQSNRPADGLPYFVAALQADPARGQYWLSYIDALHQAGQMQVARDILALAKQHGLSGDDVDVLEANLRGEPAGMAGQPQSCCPVCGSDQVSFLPLPELYRENSHLHGFAHFGKGEMISLEQYTCNHCGASDRERLYALWVDQQQKKGALSRSARVMHFAPEEALSKRLRLLFADYETADFGMGHVDYKVDLQNLPFADASYDFFICSHVLEHVESDDQAIRELYRITKPGGCGILVAPIIVGLEKTVEDPSVRDAAGRWRLYGQDDHVRLYAHGDYVNKIRSHGFRVDELGEEYFGEEVFRSLGLTHTSILYVVSK